jgi:M50 family peptidase
LALYFISGSIANIITAALFLWILKIIYSLNIGFDKLYNILQLTVSINIGYSAIQLLPIPPFSGYYFIRQLLPQHIAVKLYPLERYSMIIFLILIMTGASSILIQPLYEMITKFVFILAGMNV